MFVTTPNRWFPIEVHTRLPLVHWLPETMTCTPGRMVATPRGAHSRGGPVVLPSVELPSCDVGVPATQFLREVPAAYDQSSNLGGGGDLVLVDEYDGAVDSAVAAAKAVDAQAADPIHQRRAFDAQQPCGAGTVVARGFERALDQFVAECPGGETASVIATGS